jgi:hypothetical protein
LQVDGPYEPRKSRVGLGVFELFGWRRPASETPEDKAPEGTDVAAASVSLVVVESMIVVATGVIAESGEVKVVRLRAARHLRESPTGLSWFVAR